jgi:aminoglycoside phosphotransferase (APT) family kinase protein
MQHPRGWNSDVSALRKIQSYQIEQAWYEVYASKLPKGIKVPSLLFQLEIDEGKYLVMEDLKASGFNNDFEQNPEESFNECLSWLARFHAFHLNQPSNKLWEVGTYWHLGTRLEEYDKMMDGPLKNNATHYDKALRLCEYQTIVHGDAKPANFCFNDLGSAAAVDFQYVGRGCGMKDLIYLMSSSLSEQDLFYKEKVIIEQYFLILKEAIAEHSDSNVDFLKLKEEWSKMYTIAWLDFIRFLKGWSPENVRINTFTRHLLKGLS